MRGIDAILRRPQRIRDNLSSRQMLTVLDAMLLRALEPLACTSHTYLEAVAETLAHSVFYRRKLAADARSACFAAFFAEDASTAVEAIVETNVDRGFAFAYLERTMSVGERFERAHVEVVRHRHGRVEPKFLEDLASGSRVLGRDPSLVPALRTARFWYLTAIDFRDRIAEKYYRLAVKNAYRAAGNQPDSINAKDVFNAGVLSACRAIERFDSRSGVLTTYLERWLRGSAHGGNMQSIGRAYTVKHRKGDDASWSVPLDSVPEFQDASPAADDVVDTPRTLHIAEAVSYDPDVRAALAVSGLAPSAAFSGRVNRPAKSF